MDFKEFTAMFLQKREGITSADLAPKKLTPFKEDPYLQEKKKQELGVATGGFDSPDNLLTLFKSKIKSRGVRGMVGLQRIFNMMDDDQSGTLTQREFYKACKDFKVGISEENAPALFAKFDANKDGTMSYDEFLNTVRGPLDPARSQAIRLAYK